MFWNIVRSEWLKLRKTNIWLIVLISPILATIIGFMGNNDTGLFEWEFPLVYMIPGHGLFFLPLMSGILSAFVCRYEHQGGGWKQLLSLPVSRWQVYLAKGFVVMLFLALMQILLLVGWLSIGTLKGFTEPFPYDVMWKSIVGGLLACLPLIALQLWVSTAWSSFAAPLALNVIMTVPNILVVNSERFGPWYPWTQPFLMMQPKMDATYGGFYMPFETIIYVVLGSFVLFLISGMIYFQKKAV